MWQRFVKEWLSKCSPRNPENLQDQNHRTFQLSLLCSPFFQYIHSSIPWCIKYWTPFFPGFRQQLCLLKLPASAKPHPRGISASPWRTHLEVPTAHTAPWWQIGSRLLFLSVPKSILLLHSSKVLNLGMTLQCFYALSTQKLQMIFSIVAKYSESPSAKPSFLLREQNKMEWWMDKGVCCKCFSTFLYAWHCSKILRVGKTSSTIQMFNSKKKRSTEILMWAT